MNHEFAVAKEKRQELLSCRCDKPEKKHSFTPIDDLGLYVIKERERLMFFKLFSFCHQKIGFYDDNASCHRAVEGFLHVWTQGHIQQALPISTANVWHGKEWLFNLWISHYVPTSFTVFMLYWTLSFTFTAPVTPLFSLPFVHFNHSMGTLTLAQCCLPPWCYTSFLLNRFRRSVLLYRSPFCRVAVQVELTVTAFG